MNAAKRYKDIELPFICPITNRLFNSTKGLSVYVTKSLKMNHKEYYDKYINHRHSSCFFCGEEGKFISLGKGYRNLCEKENCIKKSFSSHTIEGFMYKNTCDKEEAEKLYHLENKRQLEERMKTFSELRKSNPNFDKERNMLCSEFWIKRGFNLEESILKINNIRKKNALKFSQTIKKNPEKYAAKYPTKIEYYLNRGISESDAIDKISQIQNRFSLVGCIEKHGKIEGEIVWKKRQNKWMITMNSKTDEEKIEINRKKLSSNGNMYSKISQKLFWDIYNIIENKDSIKFKELNNEYYLIDENKCWFAYDFVIMNERKCIEFNGEFWHCKPGKYKPDYLHRVKKITAMDIWNIDKHKINLIKSKDFDTLIVWEDDYRKNPQQILKECIEFIENKN